jgi:hypothetical protein
MSIRVCVYITNVFISCVNINFVSSLKRRVANRNCWRDGRWRVPNLFISWTLLVTCLVVNDAAVLMIRMYRSLMIRVATGRRQGNLTIVSNYIISCHDSHIWQLRGSKITTISIVYDLSLFHGVLSVTTSGLRYLRRTVGLCDRQVVKHAWSKVMLRHHLHCSNVFLVDAASYDTMT